MLRSWPLWPAWAGLGLAGLAFPPREYLAPLQLPDAERPTFAAEAVRCDSPSDHLDVCAGIQPKRVLSQSPLR